MFIDNFLLELNVTDNVVGTGSLVPHASSIRSYGLNRSVC